MLASSSAVAVTEEISNVEQTTLDRISTLKKELLELGIATKRGFVADSNDRKKANRIISELKTLNPTKDPARSYYSTEDQKEQRQQQQQSDDTDVVASTIQGKWTLVYTDAPDITTLDRNPFATLGRIGQECSPPYIKNVIEYTKPSWSSNLPFSGNDSSRVLQKVVTKASASSDKPNKVNLLISGLQIGTDDDDGETDSRNNGNMSGPTKLFNSIQNNGLIAGLLQNNPIDLNGPLDAPFGEFEILFLDDELRIIQTGQNYYAVNIRQNLGSEWF